MELADAGLYAALASRVAARSHERRACRRGCVKLPRGLGGGKHRSRRAPRRAVLRGWQAARVRSGSDRVTSRETREGKRVEDRANLMLEEARFPVAGHALTPRGPGGSGWARDDGECEREGKARNRGGRPSTRPLGQNLGRTAGAGIGRTMAADHAFGRGDPEIDHLSFELAHHQSLWFLVRRPSFRCRLWGRWVFVGRWTRAGQRDEWRLSHSRGGEKRGPIATETAAR